MIRKTPKGYVIYSESGKRLSKPYKTRSAAQRRLQQIEYFSKHRGGEVGITMILALMALIVAIAALVLTIT